MLGCGVTAYSDDYVSEPPTWGKPMDRITESMLANFSKENDLENLDESLRFEHFASYVTVQRLYGETFDTSDLVLGGAEAGIDGIAILVNGSLVYDLDDFKEIADTAPTLDVAFVFIQADRSRSFETGKMGNFVFAVRDFFKETPQLPRTARLQELADVQSAIYDNSPKFKKSNPACYLFYVTTGQWTAEQTLEARRQSGIAELTSESIFSSIDFECIGADVLQKLYRQAKNAVSRDFTFTNHVAVPEIPGVSEAYLGFIAGKDFLSLIKSEDGEIVRGLFESNLRDFQKYNVVNTAIKDTLKSDHKARFVLMNNGITIIARVLRRTAHKFHIEDFQIVNGCQTSNVLFEFGGDINDVVIPLRLISTDDEDVIQSIVTATNQQTQLSREQLFAATEFPKKLEQFFQAYPEQYRLWYERRSRQYDKLPIEKLRIIAQANMIRAFAGMFLEEPHRTTRNFNALLDKVGKEIFIEKHRLEPYYAAAYTLYKLERMFKSQKVDSKLKVARFQILLAARRLANKDALPQLGSREMANYCKKITDILWDGPAAEALIEEATKMVTHIIADNLDRDHIRTVAITEKIKHYPIGV